MKLIKSVYLILKEKQWNDKEKKNKLNEMFLVGTTKGIEVEITPLMGKESTI